MKCEICNLQTDRDVFFCPYCGHSQYKLWYSRSAFCWGGDGSRSHTYNYPGIQAVHIREEHLNEASSYPVHWNKWVFYAENNLLKIYNNKTEHALRICEDASRRYHPVIVPPFLYLIPYGSTGEIKKVNMLKLIDHLAEGVLTNDLIESMSHRITGAPIYPACWFLPQLTSGVGRIAFWGNDALKLLNIENDNVVDLYSSQGLLNDNNFAPCFDSEGDVWLMDPDRQELHCFKIVSEGIVDKVKFDIMGRASAPICYQGSIYYYLNADGATFRLIKHPGQVLVDNINFPMNRIKPIQHLSRAREDHPHYQAVHKLMGVQFNEGIDLTAYKNLVHPVWVDINGLNALILMHK